MPLDESQLDDNPLVVLKQWYDLALTQGGPEPTAAVLATVNAQGQPNARVILIKSVSAEGATFYSNYLSQKGFDMGQQPQVAINFFWQPLGRQIRMKGQAEKISAEESEAYWRTRSRGKQLAGLTSLQSKPVTSREQMDREYDQLDKEFSGLEIPRPDQWGGFLVKPHYFEFWSSHPERFHDRFTYALVEGVWQRQRLYP